MNSSNEKIAVRVPYRKEYIEIEMDPDRIAGILEPNEVQAEGTAEEITAAALRYPEGNESFREFLDSPGSLLVIVNDGTRPTPTRNILNIIADDLKAAEASFIIASGVHRAPTQEEYAFIFGDHYNRFKDRIFVHDARKTEDMVYLGTSGNGTEMYVNKLGVEAEKILVIGSVEPHYFAGYTGGRKGFLPGIASYKTIEQNHKHALDPRAKTMALKGNPVHEDMIDALKVVQKHIFSIMTVLDKHHRIYSVTAGDIHSAFYAAVEKADEVFAAPVEKKADIVVTAAKYPMDVDLYQAQKAIENAKLALKKSGTIILVAACREGVGDEAFTRLLRSSETPEQVLEKIQETYKLGYHKAGKMAEVYQWASVHALTELDDDFLESIFITPVHNLQQDIDNAVESYGESAQVLFLLDGSVTVPKIQN